VGESGGVDVPPDGRAAATRRRALVAVAAGAAVLVLLGAGVLARFGPQLRLDVAVSSAFYAGDRRPGWLGTLLAVVTAPGLTVVRCAVLLPVVAALVLRHRTRTAAWVVLAAGLVGPLTALLKEAVGRVRPPFADDGARLTTPSYPSGHSSGVATLVTVLLVLAWPLLAVRARRAALAAGAALVVVVGLSRMWLGVHYPSDVLGGWALGVAWTLAVALALGGLPGGPAALPDRTPAVRVPEPRP
jgi:membrane-associated phospholipid phosphatase